MAKKGQAIGLYADQRGRIACKEHAPQEGSETWASDLWKPMTAAEAKRFEKEVGRAPLCETCTPTPTTEPAPDPAISSKPTAAPKQRKTMKTKSDVTLEDLADRYLAHLEDTGKSQGTLFSYKLELCTALDELGAKTKLADLTPARVLEFFVCDRVMKTRTGVAKARPTYEKTRRVLRQALVWAADARLVEQAPLPEDAAAY